MSVVEMWIEPLVMFASIFVILGLVGAAIIVLHSLLGGRGRAPSAAINAASAGLVIGFVLLTVIWRSGAYAGQLGLMGLNLSTIAVLWGLSVVLFAIAVIRR